jgi:hypothetical protein
VRGAVFRGSLGGGAAWEGIPDVPAPLDPRYREDAWEDGPLAASMSELPAVADAATREGRLSTPLAHLLSLFSFGVEECHYARQR